MQLKWVTFLFGTVKVHIYGEKTDWLLNRLLHKGLKIWNIRMLPSGALEFDTMVRDFFQLRPLLKETGCRLRLVDKKGFPFLLVRLEKRKWFIAGMLGFIIGLYLLSFVVWQVEVTGTDQLEEETVLQAARQVGIYPFQWKYKLKDPNDLSVQLLKQLPAVSWVGVQVQGTKVHIKVVESTLPKENKLYNPRHLVAKNNAVITNIFAEKGRPVVEPNMRVVKGDILISGIIGEGEHREIVAAEGLVQGLVWYRYNIEIPYLHKRKILTGEKQERTYLFIGNKALKIAGFGQPSFVKSESRIYRHAIRYRERLLPFGWLNETVYEIGFVEEQLTYDEAKALALERARADVLLDAGEGATIVNEVIFGEDRNDKKLSLKLLFEVEQNIAEEQVIFKTDLEKEETDRQVES